MLIQSKKKSDFQDGVQYEKNNASQSSVLQ